MDLQTVLNAMVAKSRQETFAKSEQLSLGEIVLKLEAIADKDKLIFFDFGGYTPCGIDSWRGIYAELALDYTDDPINKPTVQTVLTMLKAAIGHTYEGYKGGDFTMSRQTPIWVAHYGISGIEKYKDSDDYSSVGVVDARDGEVVIIATQKMES